MALFITNALVGLLEIYLLIGVIFALLFVSKGVGKIDPVATAGTWGFRVLIFPGSVALWPLLLQRWMKGVKEPPQECNPHRAVARARPTGTEEKA